MRTRVLAIDARDPAADVLAEAAEILKTGGLVAFPTETVYGLGANATDSAAVARVFAVKGRPSQNPLIVHVASPSAAQALAAEWPPLASRLASRFWPGPLTLVLRRGDGIAPAVAAGGDTVAVRVPAHPVALGLLRACTLPVAAPSANRSAHVSATRAEHVLADLEGRIELILDGGPTPGGLESTVLDVTVDPPRVLRPGLVTPSAIADAIGRWPQVSERAIEEPATAGRGVLRSPGLMSRHYAPRARLVLTSGDGAAAALDYAARGRRVALVALGDRPAILGVITVGLPADAAAYAAALYTTLRDLDARGVEVIVAEMPPTDESWLAVRDRLRRAAAAETGGART